MPMKGDFMKRNISKRLVGVAAAVLACATMVTGCAGSVNLDTAVAVVNNENIPFGVAKFYTKIQQISYENYFGAMFGDDMWNQSITGDATLAETTLETALDGLKEMYVVSQHAEEYNIVLTDEETANIDATAVQFVADNNEEALDAMGASEAIIKEYLTKHTIKGKVEEAIRAGADTKVADEDAAQRTFSYVYVSTTGTTDEEGNTVELTEEEVAAKKAEAQAIVDAATESGDFNTAVTDAEKTASTASYGKDDDAGMDAEVITAADALQEGEISQVVETESGFYVLNLTSAYDEEATQSRKEEIISERKDTLYDDTYTGWLEASEITMNEKIWKKIKIEDKLTMLDTTSTDEVTVDDTTESDETEVEATEDVTAGNEAEVETEDTTVSDETQADTTEDTTASEETQENTTEEETPAN
jgi:foldase protein PrsA